MKGKRAMQDYTKPLCHKAGIGENENQHRFNCQLSICSMGFRTEKSRINKHPGITLLIIHLFILILIPALINPTNCLAQVKEPPQIFLEANQAYENGKYETAANLYQQVIDAGIVSGMLYYNLGNCYTKLDKIGKALVNYRRAQYFMPRDGDLSFNLKYVIDQRKDKIETPEKVNLSKVFLFWYYWLSFNELLYLFLIINLILWTLSIMLIYKRNDLLKWLRILAVCLFLIFGLSFAAKAYSHHALHSGVVIVQEAAVRSGNGINHSTLFLLHEGAEFKVTEQRQDWLKIYIDEGKIGWIAADSVEII